MARKSISKSTRKIVYQKYNGRCAYCGCELEYKDMQVDHIVPVYHITPLNWSELGNEIYNLMPACRMCNFYKSTYSIDEFRERLQTLTDRLEKIFIYRLAKKYGIVEERKKPIQFYFEKIVVSQHIWNECVDTGADMFGMREAETGITVANEVNRKEI